MTARIPEEVRIKQINDIPNIEFLRWVSTYKNNKSMAIVRCCIDGFEWRAPVHNIVVIGSRCPQCSGNRIWTADERINQINSLENIEFVSWVDGYKNGYSKAVVRCKKDGFEWASSVRGIVNKGNGCRKCVGKVAWTDAERVIQISALNNIEFVSWDNEYKGKDSKANVRCEIDGFEWSATAHNLVNNRNGCPRCAKYGYQLDKTGYLYALRSECGMYVKVGISNKPSQRHRQLKLATPFVFSCVESIAGDGVKIYELEKYFHSKYESAGFTGFDGATEWLKCTNALLSELRSINA